MKEYLENGIKVKEYCYEDWWTGKFSNWLGTIKYTVQNNDTKEIFIDYLPAEEYDKIIAKQKELFLQKVAEEVKHFKLRFDSTYESSENKDYFQKNEIEKYEKLLFQEKFRLPGILMSNEMPIQGLPYSVLQIRDIRELYDKLIVKGDKDYSKTSSPNCQFGIGVGDFHNVRVEAIAQYYEWIKIYKPKDTRYWIDQKIFITPDYESIKRHILENGLMKVNSIPVYTPELVFYFTSKELQVRNMDTKTDVSINGYDYFRTYEIGFKEGVEYFKAKYELPPNVLYGNNAEPYVRDIHQNYFHSNKDDFNGWSECKKLFPFIITHNAIKKYGYYSGIVSKVDEMVSEYPKLFQTFDICEHELVEPVSLTIQTKEVEFSNEIVIEEDEGRTYEFIKEEFFRIDVNGWKYCFKTESDYKIFTKLLSDFFEHKNPTFLPYKISLRQGSKTRFAKALRPIHKELSGMSLKADKKFFALLRNITQFENLTNDEIYQAVTR